MDLDKWERHESTNIAFGAQSDCIFIYNFVVCTFCFVSSGKGRQRVREHKVTFKRTNKILVATATISQEKKNTKMAKNQDGLLFSNKIQSRESN